METSTNEKIKITALMVMRDVFTKKSTKEDGGSSAQHRNWLKINDL